MSSKKVFISAALMAVVFMAFGFQSSSEHKVLFEKAKFTMETKGDLKGAIKLFSEIIEKYPGEREFAAKSQLYIGLCYEKLGLKQSKQAQKAFQKVIDNYPRQTEAVKLAKEKLSILLKAQAVVEKSDKEFKIQQVWVDPDVALGMADALGFFCAASPDGRYLSYTDRYTGGLAIFELVTKKKRRLSKAANLFQEGILKSIWSPDSSRIAYACIIAKNKNAIRTKDATSELRIIGLDDSKPHVLYRYDKKIPAAIIPLDWAPDGKSILAAIAGEDTGQAVLVSVADGSLRALETFDKFPKSLPKKVLFSPDGRYIVYDFQTDEDSPGHDIFLFSIDSSRKIPLIEHPADDFVLGWALDGKRLVFASDRTGTWDAWVIQVANGKAQGYPELVKKDIGRIAPIGFTKEGSFYYGLHTSMTDIYIATLDLDRGKLMTQPKKATQRYEGSNYGPAWSPDGQHLAYISKRIPGPEREGSRALCIRSMETGKELEFLPKLKQFALPIWSPDGRSITVLAGDKNDRWGLYKIDTQTGDISLILQNETTAHTNFTALAPDGKKIFFLRRFPSTPSSNEQRWSIIVYDLATKQEREIYHEASRMGYLVISSDGQFLAFVGRDSRSKLRLRTLKIIPATGGEAREVLRLKSTEQITTLAWTPDGQGLLFAKGKIRGGKTQKCELWRVSVEGGELQKIGLAMEDLRRMSFHPDGKRIVFHSKHESRGIWVMENFLPELIAPKKSKPQQEKFLPSAGFGKVVGDWSMEVEYDAERFSFSFRILESEGRLIGTIGAAFLPDTPLSNIEYDGENLNFEFISPTPPDGMERTLKATFKVKENRLEGFLIAEDLGESIPAIATREKK